MTYPETCGRAAVGEVWGLSFCEAHGAEAVDAARLEAYEEAGREFDALVGHRCEEIPVRNPLVFEALKGIKIAGGDYRSDHGEAVRAAYALREEDTDPDTLAYDYDAEAEDTPYDRHCEAREMVVAWMREAHEAGQPQLLRALEPVREFETVQQELARDDMERRWVAPRRVAREERMRRVAERDPSAEILAAVNGGLGSSIGLLDGVPPKIFGSEDDYFKAKRAIAEAGGLVVAALRRAESAGERPA